MKQLFLLICLFINGLSFAQKKVQTDSGSVELRLYSKDALQTYKADRQFQYEQEAEPPQSWWSRFWKWFWFKIGELFSTPERRNAMWILACIVAGAIIIYFVLKVVGMNRSGLFERNSQVGLDYTTSGDDIHQISFEEAIAKALTDANYRLATRLLYLQSLKKLSDKEHIVWKINKTNSDYLHETGSKQWSALFGWLTYQFEYAWYGESAVNKQHFDMLQQKFSELNHQL